MPRSNISSLMYHQSLGGCKRLFHDRIHAASPRRGLFLETGPREPRREVNHCRSRVSDRLADPDVDIRAGIKLIKRPFSVAFATTSSACLASDMKYSSLSLTSIPYATDRIVL